MFRPKTFGEQFSLGGFAAPFRALKSDQSPFHFRDGREPSMPPRWMRSSSTRSPYGTFWTGKTLALRGSEALLGETAEDELVAGFTSGTANGAGADGPCGS